jgi:hypothetical protein
MRRRVLAVLLLWFALVAVVVAVATVVKGVN